MKNLSFYKQGARFYDRIWRGFTQETLKRVLQALDLKELRSQKNPVRLLDIACGTGELAYHLVRLHPEIEVVGLDNSVQMLEQARYKFAGSKQVSFIQSDATLPLPFADASFEAVVFNNSLHYLNFPDKLLREAQRVLKPGGRMVVEDFTIHGHLFWLIFEKLIRLLDPQYYKTYTLTELNRFMIQAGFVILDSRNFKIDLIWCGMFVSALKRS